MHFPECWCLKTHTQMIKTMQCVTPLFHPTTARFFNLFHQPSFLGGGRILRNKIFAILRYLRNKNSRNIRTTPRMRAASAKEKKTTLCFYAHKLQPTRLHKYSCGGKTRRSRCRKNDNVCKTWCMCNCGKKREPTEGYFGTMKMGIFMGPPVTCAVVVAERKDYEPVKK